MLRPDNTTARSGSEEDRRRNARQGDASESSEPKLRLEAPDISLPKGGGALKSIDETYAINPSNGTCSLAIPFPFTAARGGYVPPVRARYDSGTGNGVLGIGWSLDMPSIRRRTDSRLPRYGGDDIFLFQGAELVPSSTWNGVRWTPAISLVGPYLIERYRPRIEGEFARIELITHATLGTNEELYAWMQGELSRTYFDCYKLAFDVAKRAEQTLKYELMRSEFDQLSLIKFGYWDSARQGLLAGDTLALDLKRLEMAYLEQNRREYEMTRHVSLARLDPLALLRLKATGSCEVTLPEWLFDMDSPGQYMRRLKTVAISIPCVTGPYTGVHCKLSLLRSSIRVSALAGDQYGRVTDSDDGRFRDFSGAIQSIVTSGAQNDSGLFEVNLRDERYLPFEGAGVIGTWRLELPNDIPQFDFESITGVVFHLRYTAREAGHLRPAAVTQVKEQLQDPGLVQLFCLKYDFGDAWFAFSSATTDPTRQLDLSLNQDLFPYWLKRLGMDDALVATFAVIDWDKRKLTLAPGTVALAGDATAGWTMHVDQASAVFPFLKKHRDAKVYMAVSYMMSS